MDPDAVKRRQSLKVIISEALMVVTVIVTVVILGFLVSGYWINSNFEVERQGLLQVSSFPTGADVYIDGESSWLQRTNTSKVLSAGEHTITLTKDGYDSWSRTITISEGLLYRLRYPRLFLQNATSEAMLDISTAAASTISPDGTKLLLLDDSMSWQLINLASDDLKTTVFDTPESLSITTGSAPVITSFGWSSDASRVLIAAQTSEAAEWLLLDLSNPSRSVNLSQSFGALSDVQILDSSANKLLALQDGNLHQIDMTDHTLSPILAENIISYSHYDASEVVYSASAQPDAEPGYYVGILRLSDGDSTQLLTTSTPAFTAIMRFYDDKYISILEGSTISLYHKDDFTLASSYNLSFAPANMIVGHDGEFITMQLDDHIATLDMEANTITEWTLASSQSGWLDSNMIYSIDDGSLVVFDFNGANRRNIARNVSPLTPVAITNDKWLYYRSGNSLIRQIIAE